MMTYQMLIDGKLIKTDDVIEWAKWMDQADRHIALTEVFPDGTYKDLQKTKTERSDPRVILPPYQFHPTQPDSIVVSTVFLGILHPHNGWFETMLFNCPDKEGEGYQERYEDIEQAREGHIRAINFVLDYFLKTTPYGSVPPFSNGDEA